MIKWEYPTGKNLQRIDLSDNGINGLRLRDIQILWGMCSDGCLHPTIGITTLEIWRYIKSLMMTGDCFTFVKGSSDKILAFQFNGVWIYWSSDCPEGCFAWINTDPPDVTDDYSGVPLRGLDNFPPNTIPYDGRYSGVITGLL